MLGLSLVSCLSAPLAWRYNRNEMLQGQPGKWMKVTNMKVAVEDNHAETMAGYKLAAEDTSTSCKI
jgi:lipocalin